MNRQQRLFGGASRRNGGASMVNVAGAGVSIAELGRSAVRGIARVVESDIAGARAATTAIVKRDGKPPFPGLMREAPRVLQRLSHDPAPVRQELFVARNSLADAHRGLEQLGAAGSHFQLGSLDQATSDAVAALGLRIEALRGATIESASATSHLRVASSVDQLATDLETTLSEVVRQVRG